MFNPSAKSLYEPVLTLSICGSFDPFYPLGCVHMQDTSAIKAEQVIWRGRNNHELYEYKSCGVQILIEKLKWPKSETWRTTLVIIPTWFCQVWSNWKTILVSACRSMAPVTCLWRQTALTFLAVDKIDTRILLHGDKKRPRLTEPSW